MEERGAGAWAPMEPIVLRRPGEATLQKKREPHYRRFALPGALFFAPQHERKTEVSGSNFAPAAGWRMPKITAP